MGKKLALLSFLLVFANCISAPLKKLQSNRIAQVLKKAKAVISGDDIDFNHKIKIWFYKASNPSLFFYNKTEYVDLIKAINEHNVDKLDVLLADYALTIQAKEILLNHAERVIASLEKEIIVESTPKPAIAQPTQDNSAAPAKYPNTALIASQPVIDNSPKFSKLTMSIMAIIGWITYVIEDKKVNNLFSNGKIINKRKDVNDINNLRPLLNTLKNPYFLVPLLFFANSELAKRLEYENKNKKVSVLPKALAVRDLILSASIAKEME